MKALDPQAYGVLIGREISAARGRLQISQTLVAARMRALGFDWHQQTVASTEKGKRRVTAEELVFLSYVLGTTVAALATPADGGLVVETPAGGQVAVASVQRSVAGIRDEAIRWDGAAPVFAEAVLEQLVADGAVSHVRVNAARQVSVQDHRTGQWSEPEKENER